MKSQRDLLKKNLCVYVLMRTEAEGIVQFHMNLEGVGADVNEKLRKD